MHAAIPSGPVRKWIVLAAVGIVLLEVGILSAEPPSIGFAAAEQSLEEMGPHNKAAWETAAALGEATQAAAWGAGPVYAAY